MWNMACRHRIVKKKYKCKYRPVCRWFKFKIQKKDAAQNFVENCLANMSCLLCCNNNGKFLKNWGKNFNVNNKQEAGGRCRLQQAGPGQGRGARLSPAWLAGRGRVLLNMHCPAHNTQTVTQRLRMRRMTKCLSRQLWPAIRKINAF